MLLLYVILAAGVMIFAGGVRECLLSWPPVVFSSIMRG